MGQLRTDWSATSAKEIAKDFCSDQHGTARLCRRDAYTLPLMRERPPRNWKSSIATSEGDFHCRLSRAVFRFSKQQWCCCQCNANLSGMAHRVRLLHHLQLGKLHWFALLGGILLQWQQHTRVPCAAVLIRIEVINRRYIKYK